MNGGNSGTAESLTLFPISNEYKTYATVLDKLLPWENKLDDGMKLFTTLLDPLLFIGKNFGFNVWMHDSCLGYGV